MSEPAQGSPQSRALTPLWVIALFISLTETVLGVGVIQTLGGIQIALTVFVLSFPLLIAGAFFIILLKKPWVLYAPAEYGTGTRVEDYVREMLDKAKSPDELQLYTQIQQAIRDTLVSTQVITELSRVTSQQGNPPLKEIRRVLDAAAVKAEEQIREQGFLTIDSHPLEGVDGRRWQVAYDRYSTVSELLDDIFFSFKIKIPSMSFGLRWFLRDAASGHIFTDIGRRWAARQNKVVDDRRLEQVGIKPGMTLEVVNPDHKNV